MPKEFTVPFLLVLILLWVYLLVTRSLPPWPFAALVLMTLVGGLLFYRIEDVEQFSVETKLGKVLATMRAVQVAVSAKADAVQHMGEEIAAAISYNLTRVGRFAPGDLDYQLGQQRERLMEMLRKIGTADERVQAIVAPLTETIRDDLARQVVYTMKVAPTPPATTQEEQDARRRESERWSLEAQAALRDSTIDKAAEAVRPILEQRGVWSPAVEVAVERFEEFRRTGHVPPAPTQ